MKNEDRNGLAFIRCFSSLTDHSKKEIELSCRLKNWTQWLGAFWVPSIGCRCCCWMLCTYRGVKFLLNFLYEAWVLCLFWCQWKDGENVRRGQLLKDWCRHSHFLFAYLEPEENIFEQQLLSNSNLVSSLHPYTISTSCRRTCANYC